MPGEQTLVVGAAIVHRGRVLTARRTGPPQARGRWEFPGGKVEPGEPLHVAAVREVAEELGCRIRVIRELAGEQPIGPGLRLRIVLAELVAAEPVPHEHDAVRWLGPEALDRVGWLDPDVPFLPQVASVLRDRPAR